jgi:hypothetical protein
MPERPASAAFQKTSAPIPMGETTPRPVTTTRLLTGTADHPRPSPTYYAKPLAASNVVSPRRGRYTFAMMAEEIPTAVDALSRELARERVQSARCILTKPLTLEPLALALTPLLLSAARRLRS